MLLSLKNVALLMVTVPSIALNSYVAARGDDPVSGEQVLRWMQESEPLRKTHYSWPIPIEELSDELLYEYARLSHALSLQGAWASREEITRAVKICHRVNRLGQGNFASLAFVFSPWDRRWKKSTPPTNMNGDGADEVKFLTERGQFLANSVRDANREHSATVQVTCVMLECERFRVRPDDAVHNRKMDACYGVAYDIMRHAFEDARIEWYNRGSIHPDSSPTGWSESRHFTGLEKGDSFSCSLYRTPEIETTREIFRRTVKNADKKGCDNVTPWVALASGYRRQTNKFQDFSFDWNYDLIYSYKLGAEINHPWYGDEERQLRFAPWRKAGIAIFNPEALGRSPHWGQHFVAYVWGAHIPDKLPQVVNQK